MAKLKNPLMSLKATGRLAKLFSLVKRRGQNIIERRPIPTDAKSPAQLFNRHMFTKCVDLWHLLSEAEKQQWESLARSRHMTGYAWFVSQCLRPNPGIYLPLQGGKMSGDIDMDGNKIEDLPDPVQNQEAATKAYVDALTKFIWKDASSTALSDLNRTAFLNWTTLDLTPYTSPNAKLAFLHLTMKPDTVGTGKYSTVGIRKKGTTPTAFPQLLLDVAGSTAGVYQSADTLVGLDAERKIEYHIIVGTNWQIDTRIYVLGYIE